MQASSINTAQRRPEYSPGDTPNRFVLASRIPPLSVGRGKPDDTVLDVTLPGQSEAGSRKVEARPRRHRSGRASPPIWSSQLNEAGTRTPATPRRLRPQAADDAGAQRSRDTNPGDTPGRREGDLPAQDRSTKAGARTPATRAEWHRSSPRLRRSTKAGHKPRRHASRGLRYPGDLCAQRRPGHEPRRHDHLRRQQAPADEVRSTKAGPRTRRHVAKMTEHYTGQSLRSTKAGPRTGHAPRRHRASYAGSTRIVFAQTKAGARTPATLPIPRRRPGLAKTVRSGGHSMPHSAAACAILDRCRRHLPAPGRIPAANDGSSRVTGRNHRRFAGASEHPGLAQLAVLLSPEAKRRILNPAGEAIHTH